MIETSHRVPPCAAALLALTLAGCAVLAPSGPPPRLSPAAQCLVDLDRQGILYQLAPIPETQTACHVENPVRVMAAGVALNPPGIVDCEFALRLESFAREVVEPVARARFGQEVTRIQQLETLSCRATSSGHPNHHATGNAIDVAGFVLADGTAIMVDRDWREPGSHGDFLRDIARRACAYFAVVLTPNADADHPDRIHLDAGPHPQCSL